MQVQVCCVRQREALGSGQGQEEGQEGVSLPRPAQESAYHRVPELVFSLQF